MRLIGFLGQLGWLASVLKTKCVILASIMIAYNSSIISITLYSICGSQVAAPYDIVDPSYKK
jgi:hypothetical protein